jgi:hypothetical protein
VEGGVCTPVRPPTPMARPRPRRCTATHPALNSASATGETPPASVTQQWDHCDSNPAPTIRSLEVFGLVVAVNAYLACALSPACNPQPGVR